MRIVDPITLELDASLVRVVRNFAFQAPGLTALHAVVLSLILVLLKIVAAIWIHAFRNSWQTRLGPRQHEMVESFEFSKREKFFDVSMVHQYLALCIWARYWKGGRFNLAIDVWLYAISVEDVTAAVQ